MAWSIFKEGGGPEVAVGWAHQLLQKLGAPDTPGNVEFIYQWEKAEGGGGKYNPLNQGPVAGKPWLTTTGEQYGGGAADFASWDAGLQGAYDFLHYNYYKGVLAGLMSNNPTAARSALWASPWAASHYGYGKNWPFVSIPGGTPVLPVGGGVGTGGIDTTNAIDVAAMDTCAWKINGPIGFDYCVISKKQLRALAGIGLGLTGLILLNFGFGLIVVIVLGKEVFGSRGFVGRMGHLPRQSYQGATRYSGDPEADNLVDSSVDQIAPTKTPPVGNA